MRLVRYRSDQEIRVGYLQGDYVIDLEAGLAHYQFSEPIVESIIRSPVEDIAADQEKTAVLQRLTKQGLEDLNQVGFAIPGEDVEFFPPVTNPGKVLCVGLNYPSIPSAVAEAPLKYPVLFHKASTSLTGHQNPIIIPTISQEVVYEGELAVIIGKPAKQINPEEAAAHIAGLTVANDVGAQDIQQRSSQWTSGKMFDSFCPIGPALVSLDEISDLNDLRIITQLNGEVVQDDRTSGMFFDIPFLLSYISQLTTLLPGDIVLTGSPKKAGEKPDPRILMQPGDVVSIEIERIGILTNPVIAEV